MQIYRYSSLSRYSIIDLANNIVYPLQPQQLRTRGLEDPQLYLRYATWNKEDNSLIYVYENDIYFRGVPNASTDVRLTKDGERDTVFNGVPDWVYEGKPILSHLLLLQLIYFFVVFSEEVLSSDNAMWLSKNGQRLVFAAFDDRNVDVFDYPLYGEPSSIQYQYPLSATIRYPKVSIHLHTKQRRDEQTTKPIRFMGMMGSRVFIYHSQAAAIRWCRYGASICKMQMKPKRICLCPKHSVKS